MGVNKNCLFVLYLFILYFVQVRFKKANMYGRQSLNFVHGEDCYNKEQQEKEEIHQQGLIEKMMQYEKKFYQTFFTIFKVKTGKKAAIELPQPEEVPEEEFKQTPVAVSTHKQLMKSFMNLFKVKKNKKHLQAEEEFFPEVDECESFSSCEDSEEISTIEMIKSLDQQMLKYCQADQKHWNFMKTAMKYSVGVFLFHLVCRIVYEKTIKKSKVSSRDLEACRKMINIVCKTANKNLLGEYL